MQNGQEHIAEPLDYLYEELPPERMAEVRKHLAECPGCRARIREVRDTVKVYRQVPHPAPPPGLAARAAAAAIREADAGAAGLMRGRFSAAGAASLSVEERAAEPLPTPRERQDRMEEEFNRLKEELRGEMRQRWRNWFFHPGWAVAALVAFFGTVAIHFSPRFNHYPDAALSRYAGEEQTSARKMRERERIPVLEPRVAVDSSADEPPPALREAQARQDMVELPPFEPQQVAAAPASTPPEPVADAFPPSLDELADEPAPRSLAAAPLRPSVTAEPRGSVATSQLANSARRTAGEMNAERAADAIVASAPPAPAAPSLSVGTEMSAPATLGFDDGLLSMDDGYLSSMPMPPPPAAVRDFSSPLPGDTEEAVEALNDVADLALSGMVDDEGIPAFDLAMMSDSDAGSFADVTPEPPALVYNASDFYSMESESGDAEGLAGGTYSGVVIFDMMGGMEPPQLIPRPEPINVAERIQSLTTLASLQMANNEIDDAWKTIEMLRRYDVKAAESLSALLSEMETAALAALENGAGDAGVVSGFGASHGVVSSTADAAPAASKYDVFDSSVDALGGTQGDAAYGYAPPDGETEAPAWVGYGDPFDFDAAEPEERAEPASSRRLGNGDRSAALMRALSPPAAEAEVRTPPPPRSRRRPFTTDPYLREH